MSPPPVVDMGLDEWMTQFSAACEAHGVEYLAGVDADYSKELERLFEEGRSPEEAIEILHHGA